MWKSNNINNIILYNKKGNLVLFVCLGVVSIDRIIRRKQEEGQGRKEGRKLLLYPSHLLATTAYSAFVCVLPS